MSSVDQTTPDISTAREEPSLPHRRRLRKPLRSYLEAYAFVILLVLAFLFFSVWSRTADTFTTSANLQVLIGGNAVVAIVALGALVPLVCNEWDLSIGASAGLGAIYGADALVHGTSLPLAILLAIAVGLIVGIINALLVTQLGVNAVITTLGISIIITGVISLKTHGVTITGDIPTSFTDFGTLNWLGIPRVTFALAAVAALVYYLLNHTPYGRYLYALGSNRSAARLAGIRSKLMIGTTFVIAGAVCAAGGMLQVARSGSADPNLANTVLLPALAAAFLSAAAIRPGRYNAAGVLVAVYFLAVLNSGIDLAGAADYVSDFVNGGALIVGVGLAVRLGGRREP
jgi:ribose transport system permease protein